MVDHIVKLKEVPKGQKLQYLWDYYKAPALITLICVFMGVYLIKLMFFPPKYDMNVLVTTEKYIDAVAIEEIENSVENLYDTEKEEKYYFTYINYDARQIDYNPQEFFSNSTKLNAELSLAESYIYIVDEPMYKYLLEEQLVATYKEIGGESEEYIKLSLGNLLENEKYDDLYITLRPKKYPQLSSDKKEKIYDYSTEFIKYASKKLAD